MPADPNEQQHGQTLFSQRARYHSSENNFEFSWPAVPVHQFVKERDHALAAHTPTGLIPLDLGDELGFDYPATTPTLLTRYAKICADDALSVSFKAAGTVYYVIRGEGCSTQDLSLIHI